jgi:predicted Zn-dependent peptidase
MIRKLHIIFIPLILLVFMLQPLSAAENDLESRVLKLTLNNGIRVLLLERRLSPTISLYMRQRTGAVDEISGKTGTAHLLEHMMFKGTTTIGTRDYAMEGEILQKIRETGQQLDLERRKADGADAKALEALQAKLKALQEEHKRWMIQNELDRVYTENGAEEMNASTGQDLTTYHVSLPSNKIELWARIESDRLQNPVFREFYSERDVIMEERRQRIETNPGGKLAEQFFAAAFQAHPYGRPILGWPSDMRFLSMDDVSAFFHQARAPSHTVISVVGDINPQETLSLIQKYFESIPARKTAPLFINGEPPQSAERRVEVIFDAKPQLMIGYHKPSPPAQDDYTFDVIEAILSKGRTSRFYRKMVEELKIAESVETANGTPGARYPNLFAIFATPRRPHACRELEQVIDAELERLKREPVPEQELQKIKNQMKADFIRSLNSNNGLASMLSYYETLLGDYRYLSNYLKVIDKITPDEILQAAQKYLRKENRTVATLISSRTPSEQSGQPAGSKTEK